MNGHNGTRLSNSEDIKYAKAYHRIVNGGKAMGLKKITATGWYVALNKHANSFDAVTEILHKFANKTIDRMYSLDITIFNGEFFDETIQKKIGFNSVKLLMSEEMDAKYKRDCDGIDFPLPESKDCKEIIEAVLTEFKENAIKLMNQRE